MAATPPGLTITVDCEVIAFEGRKVPFRASAPDGHDQISDRTHERIIIDVARFSERLGRKRGAARG